MLRFVDCKGYETKRFAIYTQEDETDACAKRTTWDLSRVKARLSRLH